MLKVWKSRETHADKSYISQARPKLPVILLTTAHCYATTERSDIYKEAAVFFWSPSLVLTVTDQK